MKKQDFQLLIETGDVERVVISREWVHGQSALWELYAYGGQATESRGNCLCTARGERREFRTLDTAYGFARECGWRGGITLEDRFLP